MREVTGFRLQVSGKILSLLLSVLVLLFTVTCNLSPVFAQQKGSTCRYTQDPTNPKKTCTGTWQEETGQNGETRLVCKYDNNLGVDCQDIGTAEQVFGHVDLPAPLAKIGVGAAGLSTFLSNLIAVIYVLAALAFMFMLIWAAFSWITAGGDKEAVAKARQRIINAFIGLLLLALAPLIFTVVGQITGFKFPYTLSK